MFVGNDDKEIHNYVFGEISEAKTEVTSEEIVKNFTTFCR